MRIDIFAHILPEKFYKRMLAVSSPSVENLQKRVSGIPALWDLGERFRIMDQFGDYVQLLSLSSPPLESFGSPDLTSEFARVANDTMAETVASHPKRFPAFIASL